MWIKEHKFDWTEILGRMRSILILAVITIIPFLSFELQLPGTATSGVVVLTAFASTNVTGVNETVTMTITRHVTSGPVPILSSANQTDEVNRTNPTQVGSIRENYTNDTAFVFNLTSGPLPIISSANQSNRTNP